MEGLSGMEYNARASTDDFHEPSLAAGSAWARRLRMVTETKTYDILVRVPLIAWFIFICFKLTIRLKSYVASAPADLPDSLFYSNILLQGSLFLFLVTFMTFIILRPSPLRKASGLQPRVTAAMGTFMLSTVVLLSPREHGVELNVLSAVLILSGHVLSVYVVFWLGRSVSIMAEARRLVVRGPYAVVRHPLYVAEEIAVIGLLIQFFSILTILIVGVHLYLQIARMINEERVLSQEFPAYEEYARRTARIIPGIY